MQEIWTCEAESGHEACWDELLDRSPQGSPFLKFAVLRELAASEHPVARVRVVLAGRGGEEASAGWAVLVRRRGIFRYCSSFPLFYAGPVLDPSWMGDDSASNRLLLLQALAREMQKGLDVMETECAPGFPEARGLLFADCSLEQIYAHVWPAGEAEQVAGWLNRGKRREMKAAAVRHEFQWTPMTGICLSRFDSLHNHTLEKFKWRAPAHWRASLLANMAGLEKRGICRLFTAAPAATPDTICAAVSVLIDPVHHRSWLWRVAYESDDPGLIPALYVRAAMEIKKEFGPRMTVNFGGSPRVSLSLFKDYLGAAATPHWRIVWSRRNWKPLVWNTGLAVKELLRRRLRW